MSRLLGEVLCSRVSGTNAKKSIAAEGENRDGKYVVVQDHAIKRPFPHDSDNKIVFIYRDPRDTIVSAKFYWKMDSFIQAIHNVAFGRWPYRQGGWPNFMCYWLSEDNADSVVSYETLLASPHSVLSDILLDMNIEPEIEIPTAVHRQSFGIKKEYIQKYGDSMPYGKDIQMSLLRRGTVGDWKNHFSRSDGKVAHTYFFNWMKVLGYENRRDWWEELSDE